MTITRTSEPINGFKVGDRIRITPSGMDPDVEGFVTGHGTEYNGMTDYNKRIIRVVLDGQTKEVGYHSDYLVNLSAPKPFVKEVTIRMSVVSPRRTDGTKPTPSVDHALIGNDVRSALVQYVERYLPKTQENYEFEVVDTHVVSE